MIKKVIILLGAVALISATPSFAGGFSPQQINKSASEGGGEAAGPDGKKNPEFEYYQVQPLMLPVVTDSGLTQQVNVAVTLEVPFGTKDDVSVYGPRLVDAYISDLFGALGSGRLMMKGNILDIPGLKARLATVTDRVMGADKDKIHGILLQAVQQRQI